MYSGNFSTFYPQNLTAKSSTSNSIKKWYIFGAYGTTKSLSYRFEYQYKHDNLPSLRICQKLQNFPNITHFRDLHLPFFSASDTELSLTTQFHILESCAAWIFSLPACSWQLHHKTVPKIT